MRIKIINPNTTQAMTDGIKKAAVSVARYDTEIICVSPERGPVNIENTHDEAYASIGVIEEVRSLLFYRSGFSEGGRTSEYDKFRVPADEAYCYDFLWRCKG